MGMLIPDIKVFRSDAEGCTAPCTPIEDTQDETTDQSESGRAGA